jgi:hypothetical protein
MKDEKLKLRDLHVSHALGCVGRIPINIQCDPQCCNLGEDVTDLRLGSVTGHWSRPVSLPSLRYEVNTT